MIVTGTSPDRDSSRSEGTVIAFPQVGDLHHRYERRDR